MVRPRIGARMIMPGIELSVIPRIDISTRVTGVTDGKEGVVSVMTRRGLEGSKGRDVPGCWDRRC